MGLKGHFRVKVTKARAAGSPEEYSIEVNSSNVGVLLDLVYDVFCEQPRHPLLMLLTGPEAEDQEPPETRM